MTDSIPGLFAKSQWRYVTDKSAKAGAVIGVKGGSIQTIAPDGNEVLLQYGEAGAGLAAGYKLPESVDFLRKILKVSLRGGHGIYVNKRLGRDLVRDDFNGYTVSLEGGASLGLNGSASMMLVGVPYESILSLAACATLMATPFAAPALMLEIASGTNIRYQSLYKLFATSAGMIGGFSLKATPMDFSIGVVGYNGRMWVSQG